MTHGNLQQLLAQVHERLGHAASLDEDTRKLLTTLMHDIERTLAGRQAGGEPAGSRLEGLAVRLQAEHPTLAGALQQLVDALAKAGI